MIAILRSGGQFIWMQFLIAVIILVVTIRHIVALYSGKTAVASEDESRFGSILFWGAFSAVLGFFAHYLGLYAAMRVIETAHDISPAVVAGGYGASLVCVISGLVILMASMIIWLLLRWLYRRQAGGRI
ncbi:hypothetical protein JXO52_11495 [bacterium]|nr:hypothetical protein [bacterium]